jgi:lactoylglutathione lyase
MITDLAHTAFGANDLDASLAFYEKLGLKESFRLNHADGSLMLVYLHIAGDRFLELFPGGPEPDPARLQSFKHICLATDDIHVTVEHLRAQGIAIDREPKLGLDNNLQAWITDPDGNAIELMQLSDDSPQRRIAQSSS